jgi:hypothetical protein
MVTRNAVPAAAGSGESFACLILAAVLSGADRLSDFSLCHFTF